VSEQRHPSDVALLCGPTPEGDGVVVLRARDGHVEAGVARTLKEGAPLHGGEVVKLTPRENTPWLADVKVELKLPAPAPPEPTSPTSSHPGPARVATSRYRDGWLQVFGNPTAPKAN
jgi:hypothetical protein